MTKNSTPPDTVGPRPSFAQILASVLTAVTSTVALSYLGVAGTIVGAAVASALTVLANYWYTRSIVKTSRTVTALAPRIAHTLTPTANAAAGTGTDTVTMPVADDSAPPPEDQAGTGADAGADAEAADETDDGTADDVTPADAVADLQHHTRPTRRRLVVLGLVLFGIILAVVTAIELGIGKPISDALRGQEGSGTTIFPTRVLDESPTPEPTGTPGETTTPPESPTPTETATPTPTPTPTPSETTTPTPTPSTTPTPTPTAPTDPAEGAESTTEPTPSAID
ncbi:MAG: hypothetical protein ACTMIR_09120 [Cellulomonadaceae bacterium]